VRLVTAAEMRAIDRAAIDGGVPGLALMERAGEAVARAALALRGPGGRVLALCGGGNNGGDGYVAARRLAAEGVLVRAVALVPPQALRGDARAAFDAASSAGVPVSGAEELAGLGAGPGDVVLDAVLGTGLARAATGPHASAIGRMAELREAGAKVLAVDLPSGLPADGGQPPGPCVEADRTVTFAFAKRGLALYPGVSLAGATEVADIGIPREAAAAVPTSSELLLEEEARALVPPRPPEAHKGDAGRVLVVAGSAGKTGAAHLALAGALRGGAGLVTLAARAEVLPLALAGRPEAMSAVLPGAGPLGAGDVEALVAAAHGMDAVVLGPGIPRGPETGSALLAFLERARLPAALDADALNALAEAGPALLAGLPAPVVLTPHPGEMARLRGTTIAEVQRDRVATAAEGARAWGCVVVLKGARTVVAAPSAPPAIVPAGNPGLATGGTGDVLAGLTGALLASRLPPFDAARAAAFAHALAGDLCAARLGQRGLLASDVADALGAVWARWGR
jgi:ADP-dependent NAD(P)H-hydrate dehydratase / NAD(P)H-hydrate epimerase